MLLIPFIYIGNCQKSKGVVEVYHSLKDAGYTLITSTKTNRSLQ